MTRALVLMKSMPPTKGHERLIEFARGFSESGWVLMDTAPDEPLQTQRWDWLSHKVIDGRGWTADWLRVDDQDSDSPGFWERWKERIDDYGQFDFVIGSEPYCAKVAEVIGSQYIPYDPDRELAFSRATTVRTDPLGAFSYVAPDFQKHLRTTVTIFGAESTGKTTLSKALAKSLGAEWTFEWAKPYLEIDGPEANLNRMNNIWHGQYAVEKNAEKFAVDKPFIVRDTDLYSTLGYWLQPEWHERLGPMPLGLQSDARHHQADLYIITQSNIPFEKDPLRYGGDHREQPDKYWIDLAEQYELPYVVLTGHDKDARLINAGYLARKAFYEKNQKLTDAVRV